jgi:myb proto-oncogene protein
MGRRRRLKLKDAVQTHGDKDWNAITALVPGRTKIQCYDRWRHVLNPNIDRTTGRTGRWAEDEDIKLKDAVQTHGDKDWVVIAGLVPGRAESQWYDRWCRVSDFKIVQANKRTGKWIEDEDIKLKDAVLTHGENDWGAIAALVPGRTQLQCQNRWQDYLDLDIVRRHDVSDPNIVRVCGSKVKWTAVENRKLQDAVQTHGDKDWGAITALVPGRTKIQCRSRWYNRLHRSIDQAKGRTGAWVEDEDIKLKDQTHGAKDWPAIAALVPGRTQTQCRQRWHRV